MKKIIFGICCLLSLVMTGQASEKVLVKENILAFFEAFHKQDSTALKLMVAEQIMMQSISENKEGQTVLNDNEFSQFLKSLASIPIANTFEEKLLDFSIQVDGNMANAWVPYEFWYNGNFSHCGVNSFQLMKVNSKWKIIYLVDTRRREGCHKNFKD